MKYILSALTFTVAVGCLKLYYISNSEFLLALQNLILLLTGILILFYTIETVKLRNNATRERILSVLKIYLDLLDSSQTNWLFSGSENLGEWVYPADDRHILYYKDLRNCIPHIEIAIDTVRWVDGEKMAAQDQLTCFLQIENHISKAANKLFSALEPLPKWEEWLQKKYGENPTRWSEFDPNIHIPEIQKKSANWKQTIAPLKLRISTLRTSLNG